MEKARRFAIGLIWDLLLVAMDFVGEILSDVLLVFIPIAITFAMGVSVGHAGVALIDGGLIIIERDEILVVLFVISTGVSMSTLVLTWVVHLIREDVIHKRQSEGGTCND